MPRPVPSVYWLQDVLVDLLAEPTHEEDLQVPGVCGRAYVHSGILKCARELLKRLLHDCPENPHGRPLLDHAKEVLKEQKGEAAVEVRDQRGKGWISAIR